MSTILLKDIPRKCPECDALIFIGAPRPQIGKLAWAVVGLGVIATAVWLTLFFLFSPVYIQPQGLGGIALCGLVYGWPVYISALIAWKMPLEVRGRCTKCSWQQLYKVGIPKLK